VFKLPDVLLRENDLIKEYFFLLDYLNNFPKEVFVNQEKNPLNRRRFLRSVKQAS